MRIVVIVRWWALVLAGVFGAAGVASAAASSHGPALESGAQPLASLALICLSHAPVLLALGLAAPRQRRFDIAAGAIGLGAAVFSIDMAMRALLGGGMLPLLAPLSGFILIGGWVWLICIGLMALPR